MRAVYAAAVSMEKTMMQIPPPSPNRFVVREKTWNSLAGCFNSRIVMRKPKHKERMLMIVSILFDDLLEGKDGKRNITKAVNSKHKFAACVNDQVIFSMLVAMLSSLGEGAIHISMQRTADTADVTKRRT